MDPKKSRALWRREKKYPGPYHESLTLYWPLRLERHAWYDHGAHGRHELRLEPYRGPRAVWHLPVSRLVHIAGEDRMAILALLWKRWYPTISWVYY